MACFGDMGDTEMGRGRPLASASWRVGAAGTSVGAAHLTPAVVSKSSCVVHGQRKRNDGAWAAVPEGSSSSVSPSPMCGPPPLSSFRIRSRRSEGEEEAAASCGGTPAVERVGDENEQGVAVWEKAPPVMEEVGLGVEGTAGWIVGDVREGRCGVCIISCPREWVGSSSPPFGEDGGKTAVRCGVIVREEEEEGEEGGGGGCSSGVEEWPCEDHREAVADDKDGENDSRVGSVCFPPWGEESGRESSGICCLVGQNRRGYVVALSGSGG